MIKKEYSFKKLTDSYILFHKRVPNFLFWIIIIFFLAITGIIIWSAFVIKPYVVKAQSVITVRDKTLVTVSANASIKNVNIFEGDKVKKGDILLEQDTTEIDSQIYQINVYIEYYQNRISLYDRLLEYINKDYSKDEQGNCFDKDNFDELEFYNYMNSYELEKNQYFGNQTALDSLRIQTLNNYIAQKNSLKTELDKYLAQKKALEENMEIYIIRAQNDGIVHWYNPLHSGLFLQAGVQIGIISNNTDTIIAECYLSTDARPKVSIGDKVELEINGLIQNDFGIISGELIEIDSNATASEEMYYFKAIIKLDKTTLSSKRNTVDLVYGMQAEARITYEQTTYLNYFLEQIGIHIK